MVYIYIYVNICKEEGLKMLHISLAGGGRWKCSRRGRRRRKKCWEQSKVWERKETKDEEPKESLKILRNISPFLHQHLTLATLALIITVIFFQRRCRRSPLRMSASRNSPWPLQPSSRSKWILLQCLIIPWNSASFLTNFHLVTSGLAR